jgi:DNA processing protein
MTSITLWNIPDIKMDREQLTYIIALQQIAFVGPVHAKNLIAYCGSPEGIFSEKKAHLKKIPGIGEKIAHNIWQYKDFEIAEKEMIFIEKHNIKPLFYLDEEYPSRLKDVEDAPILLFYKGNATLNGPKMLAVVGTRSATNYGKRICDEIVSALKDYNVTIVSGLAFGIDHCAHKASVKNNIPTIGVLAHGLDTIYPSQHRSIAINMLNNGGLLTEYISGTQPNRENFPMRNRIVAGMTDAVLVVETARRGGALITAEIAYSYNREVLAVPGRSEDEMSAGCNHYIKINKACLVESANDIAYLMGWDLKSLPTKKPPTDISKLSQTEQELMKVLKSAEKTHIDKLVNEMDLSHPELSLALLDLEFRGFLQALPGNFYKPT